MEDELKKQIDDIAQLVGCVEEDAFGCWNYKEIIEQVKGEILTLIRKREIELLEGLKWEPRESWADDVVRHNGQIDMKIKKLKEVSNDNNNS